MAGAFQTSRDIFVSPIWKNVVEFRLFFLIYGSAVFSEEGYRVTDDLILQRGQWLRSTRKLQEDLEYIENRQVKRYSTSVINRCIKSLTASQRLCTKTHELGTVFTVQNYEQYQGLYNYRNTNLERDLEQCENSVGTIEEQHQNNNKKENNENKDNKDIKREYVPYSEIITYLNLKSNSSYKSNAKATQRHIKARWSEGYRLIDFETVIDKKTAEWLTDEKMNQYLRPETLFGSKFENYLNQKIVLKGGQADAAKPESRREPATAEYYANHAPAAKAANEGVAHSGNAGLNSEYDLNQFVRRDTR